ncbi:hypothetical protein EN873_23740 [bacterium M00.F.Ca.ET.230.01.1.1]|nr:hypothetical protein EN873_23740 [bacterium M00.F.Ca.ET.230.01.1.1]
MLRATLLEMAERHVQEGKAIIARQRALIDRLARDGHPTGDAWEFLRKFQKAQEEHIAHLQRLLDD